MGDCERGALGRGSASLLSLARKGCSLILVLATFWVCLGQNEFYPGSYLQRNALFSLDQIQPEPRRQGAKILRSGIGFQNHPLSLTTPLPLLFCLPPPASCCGWALASVGLTSVIVQTGKLC